MKPEKIIRVCDALKIVFVSIMVIMLILTLIAFSKGAEICVTFICLTVVSAIPIPLLDLIVFQIREKLNPLYWKKQKVALEYAVANRYGTRDDFIKLYGHDMYNHFIRKCYIHEPFVNKGRCWEITVRGKETSEKWKSNK